MFKKKFAILCAALILVMCAVGCSSQKDETGNLVGDLVQGIEEQNAQDDSDQETMILGTIQHQPQGINVNTVTEDDLTYDYVEGEYSLPYQATVTGNMVDVGFLIFIDGVATPYKIDSKDAEYEFCHSFHFDQEGVPCKFTFLFTPSFQNDDVVHSVSIVAITNPDFKPDMVKTSAYGANTSYTYFDLYLRETKDRAVESSNNAPNPNANIKSINQEDALLTEDLMSRNWIFGGPFDPEMLQTNVRQVVTFDDKEVFDNFKVDGTNSVKIKIYTCGVPGAQYKTTFFLDNYPICTTDGQSTFNITLQKEMVNIIEVDLDAEMINDGSTFYAFSVPVNKNDFTNCSIGLYKTLPVLLY